MITTLFKYLNVSRNVVAPVILSLVLLIPSFDVVASEAEHYERAVEAYHREKYDDAFIHLKNALQINPKHLPSKILFSKVFFNSGNIHAAEKELLEAMALGADVNIILPLLGSSLILQEKMQEFEKYEKYFRELSQENQFEWLLLRGQYFGLRKNTEEAQRQFERALDLQPDNTRAINTLANLYVAVGWLDKADTLVNRSISLDNKNAKTWQLRGELELKRKQLKSALSFFYHAHELDTEDPKIMRSLAVTNLRVGNLKEAHRFINVILAQSPNDPTATLIAAWLQLSDNDMETAKQTLSDLTSKLTQLDDKTIAKDDTLLFVQGASAYMQGNYENAIASLDTYLDKRPDDRAAINLLMNVYFKTGQLDKVKDLLEKHEKTVAKDMALSVQLASIYVKQEKLLSAENILKRLQSEYPPNPFVTVLEAQILNSRGLFDRALAVLTDSPFQDVRPLNYLLLQGELFIKTDQLKAAEDLLAVILKDHSNQIDALNFAAAVYLRGKQPDLSEQFIKQVLKVQPDNLTARVNQAILLGAQNKWVESAALLTALLEKHPDRSDISVLLARNHIRQGKQDAAISVLDRSIIRQRDNPAPYELKYQIYTDANQWESALAVASDLKQLDRMNSDYLKKQIVALIKLERFGEATHPLKVLYSMSSGDITRLFDVAKMQMDSQQTDEAKITLDSILHINPKNQDALLIRVQLAINEKDSRLAETYLNRLEAASGKSSSVVMMRGDLARLRNKDEDAYGYYEQAFKRDESNHLALIRMYQMTIEGEFANRFNTFLESVITNGNHPDWQRKLLADSYLNQKKYSRAQTHYEVLLEGEFGKDKDVLNNLANIYALSDRAKGLALAKKAFTQYGKSAPLLDTIGWLLSQEGQHREALAYLREAFSIKSNDPEIRYHLGYTLHKLDRSVEARIELESALSYSGEFEGREDARKLYDFLGESD